MKLPAATPGRRPLVGLAVGLALVSLGAPALADDIRLEAMQVEAGDRTEVVIAVKGSAEGSAVSSFVLHDPERLVIDVADAEVADDLGRAVSGGLVKSVEAKSWDDGQGLVSRVVLTLTGPASHEVHAGADGIRVVLTPDAGGADPVAAALSGDDAAAADDDVMARALTGQADEAVGRQGIETPVGTRPLSGPQVDAGIALSSLDFQNLDDVSRVIIGLKGTDRYTIAQPQDNLVVVDVPGAFLPSSLGRVLDASGFASPVRMVRAYRTSSGARVAISLRASTTYQARLTDDGLLLVDLAIPPGMKPEHELPEQAYAAVSPGTPQEGLKGAYQQEIMIGSGGRTVNPQAAFGSGAGASDPAALLGMASGFAYDSSSAAATPYTGQHISLDFVNADIHNIFRLISHVSRLNIVAGDDVKGRVTVRMIDVPWDQALAAILQAKGLGSQRFGNIIRVAPIETIKAEQQSALEAKRAQEELTDLDLLVIPLNYVKADEIQDKVQALLSGRGSVQVDKTSNQLIIKETADRLAQIRELLRQLDKQTPQVLIEARIVEANSSYSRALGIQWGAEVDASTRTGASTGLFFPNSIGISGGNTTGGAETYYTSDLHDALMVDLGAESSTSSLALSLGSISGLVDIDARLSAMESDGWGKVVSSPKVTTLDNKTAKIIQGARIPFLSTSSGGTNVQFINASLELEVTPHITSDGRVFLQINVKNDRADFSQLVQGQPAILQKEAETELLVADGDTTVLGGVFTSEDSETKGRTPFLGAIPILGYLFRNSSTDYTRNEMLVFVTPHIINKPVEDAE